MNRTTITLAAAVAIASTAAFSAAPAHRPFVEPPYKAPRVSSKAKHSKLARLKRQKVRLR